MKILNNDRMDRTYWTTNDEINFIRNLGTGKWSKSIKCRSAGRETLLRRYQAAALNRDRWERIERGKVMSALNTELTEFMPL